MAASPETPIVQPLTRKLSAIFSADVKGYSRLMNVNEVATIRMLAEYRECITHLIESHRGRVIDAVGDNVLADFASAVEALECAVAIQRELKTRNDARDAKTRMEFRIGLNVGDVVVEDARIYGDGVNIAARLEALAEPGGICISGTVFDHVEGKLPFRLVDLGAKSVKNIAKPVRVYRVEVNDDELSDGSITNVLSLPDKPSLVVLPFLNLSDDSEQEYFSDGITEDLITDLSKLSGLFVISRNSAFLYKGRAVSPDTLSKELGVRYLVEGSVRRAGERLRITAQLIDATTNFHLWSERFDRERKDIFEVQDEVTRRIVDALKITLTPPERSRVRGPITSDVDAYDLYLRGVDCHGRRTREANTEAQHLFEQALACDPKFAAASAMLGRVYLTRVAFQWGEREVNTACLRQCAERAVALDPSLSTAHETLAFAYLGAKQHDLALQSAERAVALEPSSADALVSLGEILSFSGRAAEAVPRIEQAMRLNPRYPASYLWALGQAYQFSNRLTEAVTLYQRVLARNPAHLVARLQLAVIYSELGQLPEAQAQLAEIRRINPVFSLRYVIDRIPYRNAEDMTRVVDSLKRAGFE